VYFLTATPVFASMNEIISVSSNARIVVNKFPIISPSVVFIINEAPYPTANPVLASTKILK
jgi:hypothetical protein